MSFSHLNLGSLVNDLTPKKKALGPPAPGPRPPGPRPQTKPRAMLCKDRGNCMRRLKISKSLACDSRMTLFRV